MRYAAVLVDMGGVTVEVESDRLMRQISQMVGRPFEDIQAAVYHRDLLLPFELGKIGARAYYEGLQKQLTLTWTYEQFVRAWNGIFRENADVTKILQRLREHHKLVALTNTNELHLHCIRATIPSLALIEEWVASCDVGCRKPEPEIYRLALARAGAQPQETIYIDDRPEMVEAGRSIGLAAIRFESSRQLQEALQAIGLNL